MTKFKIGDRVKAVKETSILRIGSEYTILRYVGAYPVISNGSVEIDYWDDYFELVKPAGFEVGKKYTLISTGHRVEVLHSNEKEHWLKNEKGKTFIVHDRDFICYEEYIPPPPEEWRIVYKDRYGNVTIGKTPFKSESEAKASRYWTDHKSSAFKIIRVEA